MRSRETPPALTVVTRPLPEPVADLLEWTDSRHPLAWIRGGDGIVGTGVALRADFSGRDRFRAATQWWRSVVAAATVDDPIDIPATGLVAFGTFAFASDSDRPSTLLVPSTVLGRRDGRSWLTRIFLSAAADAEDAEDAEQVDHAGIPVTEIPPVRFQTGAVDETAYPESIRSALALIADGVVEKVVLARDLVAELPAGTDLRAPLERLSSGYPDCWTFAVDGLIGSTPEMLASVEGGTVRARVLAGSTARGVDTAGDRAAALALATSDKDRDEHGYAVRSVLSALTPHTSSLVASELPFALKLPNLWHLASDVEGCLADASTSLDLVDALHPTAAVAGTPTAAALTAIARIEPFDRGRYAGPVGWLGADGDGEWGIALRCAQVDADTVTAYAGAGVVTGSQPGKELAETGMKFRPIIDAFR